MPLFAFQHGTPRASGSPARGRRGLFWHGTTVGCMAITARPSPTRIGSPGITRACRAPSRRLELLSRIGPVMSTPRSAAAEIWIASARNVHIEDELARRGIKLRGKVERAGPCPKCGGDDRFSINTAKQVFNCRGCGADGDVIDLVRFLDGVEFVEACTTLAGKPPAKVNGKDHAIEAREVCTATFTYHDESGTALFMVGRLQYRNLDGSFVLNKDGKPKKTFRQKRPDPDRPGQWIYNVDGVRTVPYRLPELIEAIGKDHLILIVEGEAKVDLLRSWNMPATCNAQGAKKWKPEHSQIPARRRRGDPTGQ